MSATKNYSGPSDHRTVDITIDVSELWYPGAAPVVLAAVPVPIMYEELCSRLVALGFPKPQKFMGLRKLGAVITSGPSSYSTEEGGRINLDEPLIAFTGKHYTPTTRSDSASEPQIDLATLEKGSVVVGGVKIGFHRTIRVPDNNDMNALPPGLGKFPLYNAVDFADRAFELAAMGGVIMPMYQREALWMSFEPENDTSDTSFAVKVSVGGINALTGRPQYEVHPGYRQNYLSVRGSAGQPWLDGVYTSRGVVRQFVAMPLGSGFTVEGQLTGQEKNGGIQIDVFPSYEPHLRFCEDDNVDVYSTPRWLGWQEGQHVVLEDRRARETLLRTVDYPPPRTSPDVVTLDNEHASLGASTPSIHLAAGGSQLMCVWMDVVGAKIIPVFCTPKNTVRDIKNKAFKTQYPVCAMCPLYFAYNALDDSRTLADYNIREFTTFIVNTQESASLRYGGMTHCYGSAPPAGLCSPNGLASVMGLAAGGQVKQKIVKDARPASSYDQENGVRLLVTILDSASFASVAGFPAPPSPVSAKTYLAANLPWYTFYDEGVPAMSLPAQHPLANVHSVGALMEQGCDPGDGCGYCTYELATWRVHPCGHMLCDDCAQGLEDDECPARCAYVHGRVQIAGPMPAVGSSERRTVNVKTNPEDPRIVALKRMPKGGIVGTVRPDGGKVSPLSEGEVYGQYRRR